MPSPAELWSLFTAERRLYELQGEGPIGALEVESWSGREALSEPFALTVQCLSLSAGLDLNEIAGQRVVLTTRLADGSLTRRSALVREAVSLGADAGFACYRLQLAPWLWLASQASHSRVWQDKTVAQITGDVLAAYAAYGHVEWTPDAQQHPASTRARRYCVQYRETDLAFVSRLLAEEGLGYVLDEGEEDEGKDKGEDKADKQGTPGTPRLLIFADSISFAEEPSARSPLGGRGLRFHRAAAPEEQDTLQHWGASRELQSSVFTVIGWDPVTKRSIAASLPTVQTPGGPHAPVLEAYDWVGVDAFTSGIDAQARTDQISQTLEARNQTFDARSTVRSLRPGRWFELTGSTFDQLLTQGLGLKPGTAGTHAADDPAPRQFSLTAVTHAARNNLPKALEARLQQIDASLDADTPKPGNPPTSGTTAGAAPRRPAPSPAAPPSRPCPKPPGPRCSPKSAPAATPTPSSACRGLCRGGPCSATPPASA